MLCEDGNIVCFSQKLQGKWNSLTNSDLINTNLCQGAITRWCLFRKNLSPRTLHKISHFKKDPLQCNLSIKKKKEKFFSQNIFFHNILV